MRSTALLSPTVNGGAFTIGWSAISAMPFNADIYLSGDQFSDVGDILLFTRPAVPYSDSGGSGYVTKRSPLSCVYATNNTIDCGTAVSIQSFLDVLPKSAYIIVQVCDLNAVHCMANSAPITLE